MDEASRRLSATDWPKQAKLPGWVQLAVPVLLGCGAAALAAEISNLELKFAAAATLAIVGGMIWLCFSLRTKMLTAIAVCVFGISLKLSKTFFLVETVPGQYVPTAGGAGGLTISAHFLAALAIIGIAMYRRRGMDRFGLRLEPILISGPLLFMAAGIFSMLNEQYTIATWFELSRQVMLLVTMVAMLNLEPDELRMALRLLALSIILQAAIASVQFATGSDLGLAFLGEQEVVKEQIDFSAQTRATGTIGHSNALSYMFEITGPLILALLTISKKGTDRLLYLTAFGAVLVGTFVTLSRAAWIAEIVTLPMVAFILYGSKLWKPPAVYVILGGLVAAAASTPALPLITRRLLADDAGSASHRWPLIRAAFSVVQQFPVFGVGLNNFGAAFQRYDTTHYARVFGPINHVVHNLYMLVWTEVGTVGLLAFFWGFAGPFWIAVRAYRCADPFVKAVAVGGAAGLLAHLIHGFFDPGFKLNLPISSLIACQIGLIGAAYLTGQEFTKSRIRSAERRQLN